MFREFYMDRSDRKAPRAIEGITRKTMMAAFNSRGIQAGELSSASSRCELIYDQQRISSDKANFGYSGILYMYRVTIQVVTNLPLTSIEMLRFSIRSSY